MTVEIIAELDGVRHEVSVDYRGDTSVHEVVPYLAVDLIMNHEAFKLPRELYVGERFAIRYGTMPRFAWFLLGDGSATAIPDPDGIAPDTDVSVNAGYRRFLALIAEQNALQVSGSGVPIVLTDVLYPGIDLMAEPELSAELAHSNTMGAAHLVDQLCQLIHMKGGDPGQWLAELALDNEENPLEQPCSHERVVRLKND